VIDQPKEPPKLDDDFDDDGFSNERPTTTGGESMPEERPTVSPPFDVEEYAKSSDSKVRTMKTPSPRHPDASTKPPPAPDFDLDIDIDLDLPREAAALPIPDRPRPPQITLTDEYETEEARLRSISLQTDPPPQRASTGPVSSTRADVEEAPPPTVAYPTEYERDPFAHLNQPSSLSRAPRPATNEMSDRFSLGDYTGALELAESILARDPANVDALQCADESRAKLVQMYTARIGPLDRVPMVVVAREQLRWLSIDHRAGFLLSHIDGVSSLEMILDVSGMPLLDALKILCELSQQKVITFR
jgi:hypothetical protein